MKYRRFTIYVSSVFFLLSLSAHAHGVKSMVDTGGIIVTAQYDTGEGMSYARVTIYAPEAELTFQSGRTDRNGRFCFFPDVPGEWKVVVDDEVGHRLEIPVPVNEIQELETDKESGQIAQGYFPRYQKALMGISIIFGISGSLLGWKGYTDRKKRS